MRAITSIGQVGIKTPSGEYLLTPSLAAIASLKEPVDLYTDLLSQDTPHEYRMEVAHQVILACSSDRSISKWLGLQLVGKPRVRKGVVIKTYGDVYIDDIHAVAIAESLLFHGMVGKIERRASTAAETDYTDTFNPVEWVAAVVAHLGLSEADAWGMTMTSVLAILKTKFPPSEKQKALDNLQDNKAAHDEWYRSIYGPDAI